ncbi:hypothetical protein KM043_004526 [Ampulex compressa]|nr:hypothetical protein KM043_004526 [Ampulex compressa]
MLSGDKVPMLLPALAETTIIFFRSEAPGVSYFPSPDDRWARANRLGRVIDTRAAISSPPRLLVSKMAALPGRKIAGTFTSAVRDIGQHCRDRFIPS